MTRAIIYDQSTGDILRVITGKVNLEHQNLSPNEAVLIDEEPTDPPDNIPVAVDTNIPGNLGDKRVDTASKVVVTDASLSPPRPKEDIKADLIDGNITLEAAVLELLDR